MDSWLRGTGAAAIDNLMEDAATAEIARSQLWLWRVQGLLSAERYGEVRDEELARLGGAGEGRLKDAWDLLDHLVLDDDFADFLTLRAYAVLE
jgi:malate synthase